MSYVTEEIATAPVIVNPTNEPNQFNLPVKEFIGYDPKGTQTVTGSERVKPESEADKPSEKEKTDPKQADKPEEEKKDEESVTLSPKISAIARKEQAQRQREQALKQREKDLADKIAKAEKYDQLRGKLEAKDYSAADELGMSYEEYTQYLLNKQASTDPTEQRFRKIETENETLKRALEEKETQEYQANQALWREAISKAVAENDEFSTIRELKAESTVLQHINDSFEEDGVELTVEQAAKEIEEALVKRAEKLSSISKLKKGTSEETKVLGPPKTQPRTLTQNMTTTSVKSKPKPFHLMSESEQLAEAIRRVNEAKLTR